MSDSSLTKPKGATFVQSMVTLCFYYVSTCSVITFESWAIFAFLVEAAKVSFLWGPLSILFSQRAHVSGAHQATGVDKCGSTGSKPQWPPAHGQSLLSPTPVS